MRKAIVWAPVEFAAVCISKRADQPTRYRVECASCSRVGKWTTDNGLARNERDMHNTIKHASK